MTIQIPSDIWLHVATFIPASTLLGLIGLNSVFFDLAMSERYREITINFSPKEARLLERLRDPFVSKRVRYLRLNPLNGSDPAPAAAKTSVWKRGLNVIRSRAALREPVTQGTQQREMVEAAIKTVSGLFNVAHCDVTWWYPLPIDTFQTLLPIAWSTFGSNLRKLSIAGHLEGLQILTSSSTPFVALRELELEFVQYVSSLHTPPDMTAFADALAPFVNGLSPTLQHLSVTSWSALELESFFHRLHVFPLLRELTIRISFNKAFPVNSSGLTRILHDHSGTLKDVTLRFNPSAWMAFPSTEESLVQWMQEAASDEIVLNNLQKLHIYPTMTSAGFQTCLTYLRRSADTLTTLIIRDRYLSFDEVDSVVSMFMHRRPDARLKCLRLNVRILNARLLDLLAMKAPRLNRLTLIVGEGWTEGVGGGPSSTPEILESELRDRIYADWKLYDIGIWKGGAKVERDLMLLLTDCIPSLKSFWGQGDKLLP